MKAALILMMLVGCGGSSANIYEMPASCQTSGNTYLVTVHGPDEPCVGTMFWKLIVDPDGTVVQQFGDSSPQTLGGGHDPVFTSSNGCDVEVSSVGYAFSVKFSADGATANGTQEVAQVVPGVPACDVTTPVTLQRCAGPCPAQ